MSARIATTAVLMFLLPTLDLSVVGSVHAKENDASTTIARIFRTQDKNHDGVLRDDEIEATRRVIRGGVELACDRIESHPRMRRIQPPFDRKRVFAVFADSKLDENEDGQVSEEELSRFYRSVHGPIFEAQRAMQNGAPAEIRPVDPGPGPGVPGRPPAGNSGRSDRDLDRDRERDLERRERELRERRLEANERQRSMEQQQRAAAERAARDREARERQQQEQQRQRDQADRRRADEERRRDTERRERDAQQQRRALDARKSGR